MPIARIRDSSIRVRFVVGKITTDGEMDDGLGWRAALGITQVFAAQGLYAFLSKFVVVGEEKITTDGEMNDGLGWRAALGGIRAFVGAGLNSLFSSFVVVILTNQTTAN